MAITRKFLSAMGIEEDKAEQIINAHLETVDPLKQERDELKKEVIGLKDVQKQLDESNSKLKEYEKDNAETWRAKYDVALSEQKKVQKEFEDYKADVASKELAARKRSAYRDLLKATGVSEKRLDTVLKVTDLSGIELDEDGKIKDIEKYEDGIKSEWSDFIGTVSEQGAKVSNPEGKDASHIGRPASKATERAARYHADRYGVIKMEVE